MGLHDLHSTPALGSTLLPTEEEEEALFLPSFAQERLWFLDQFEPNNPSYNIHLMMRMQGALHLSALEESLQAIVERHEALRTTFVPVDGRPMQAIAPYLKLALSMLDLSGLSELRRGIILQHLATTIAELPFDLRR